MRVAFSSSARGDREGILSIFLVFFSFFRVSIRVLLTTAAMKKILRCVFLKKNTVVLCCLYFVVLSLQTRIDRIEREEKEI